MYRNNNLKLCLSLIILGLFNVGISASSSSSKTSNKIHGRVVSKAALEKNKMTKAKADTKANTLKKDKKRTSRQKASVSKKMFVIRKKPSVSKKSNLPTKITLDYSLKQAVKTHPSVLSSFYGFKSAKAKLSSAKGAFLPSLKLSTSYKLNKDPNSFFSKGQNANSEITKDDSTEKVVKATPTSSSGFKVTGGLDYELFSSFKHIWGLSKASCNSKAAIVDYHGSKLDIANETGSSYIDVRRLFRLTNLYKDTVNIHQKFLKKVKTRVSAGQLASDAIDATLSKLEESKQALITAQSDFETNKVSLEAAIGQTNIIVTNAKIDDKLIPVSLDKASALMQTNNIEILKARHAYDVAKYNYKETIAGNGPTLKLSLETSYTSDENGYKGDFDKLKKTHTTKTDTTTTTTKLDAADTPFSDFSVSIDGNFTAKGGMFSDIAAVAAEKKKAYYNMMAQGLKASAELKIAWINLVEARKKADSLLTSVESKKTLMDSQIKKFDLNRANLISVLVRIEEYNRDKARLISAQADLDKAELALLAKHTGTAISVLKI